MDASDRSPTRPAEAPPETPSVPVLSWIDGELTTPSAPAITLEDRGLLFGEAVYEAILLRDGRPFMAEAHLARLERSGRGIGLDPDRFREAARSAVGTLAARARIGHPEAYALLYLQVNGGAHPRDHLPPRPEPPPRIFATLRPFPMARIREDMARGVSGILRPDRRWGGATWKTTQLLPNVLGKRGARDAGAAEAVFLDRDGYLLEGGSANLFVVFQGVAVTPPLSRNILPGITRDRLLEAFPGRVAEADLRAEWLERAEEIFLTSTTRPILPIVRLDGRPIGTGRPGPRSRALADDFLALLIVETS